VRLHAKELPQVPRPETAGSVSDMLGNQRVTAVLRKGRNPALDLLGASARSRPPT